MGDIVRSKTLDAERVARGDLSDIAVDPVAFEAFYRCHVGSVTRFVARRVADPHTVADLTAEVFLAVIGSARSYCPGRGTELAWLLGIARNVTAAERRRAAHERRTVGRISGHRLLDSDDIARLEDRIDAESAGRAACLALARLPEEERAVLELVAEQAAQAADPASPEAHRPARDGYRGPSLPRGVPVQRRRTGLRPQ
jgi:RNA polymerase sigma factor (sigma-70 family)